MADLSRRDFIASTGIGLTCWVSGVNLLLSPEQARAASIPLDALSDSQATTLGALGNALVPGARTAGLVQYVDKQLGVDNTL
ncbi:MAG: Tat pathway signal protein, partial [Porticoccaceae bacterium]|nr:Tat pathway signal protein [Porticoccaceae bacterium]